MHRSQQSAPVRGLSTSAPSRPVVIVPVFNAVDALSMCLEALHATLGVADTVILADDASTDPEVGKQLHAFEQSFVGTCSVFRRERNLGFVGNVNEAMRSYADRDAVLLNSDTLPAAGWCDRMVEEAARDPRIATLTPWSNNAEICSIPRLCESAPLPDAKELARLADAALSLRGWPLVELPTAVGFAMYIRRAAWDALGGFDLATFGHGYGEENDFCMRVANHGWRNVLCATAFVGHRGNASFSAFGLRAGGENLQRLCARYPDYNKRVADFISADPLAPMREHIQSRMAA